MLLGLKRLLVRTPLEPIALRIRALAGLPSRLRHPEMREIYLEDGRISRALRRIVRPDSNCIDIGCHIGSSLSELMRLAPLGRHAAFEPLPQKARWLKSKFPEVEIHEVALSDQPGQASFFEDLSADGYSSLGQPGKSHPAREHRNREITVTCDTLDRRVDPSRPIHFIKIDIEGAELMALRGGVGLLTRHRPLILFESGPDQRMGLTHRALFEFFAGQGYNIWLLKDYLEDGKPLDCAGFEEAHRYPFKALNYLAVPA